MSLVGIVMAAGKGSRMRSRIPKPLHRICGKEMVRYPVELLRNAGADRVIVVVSPDNREAIETVLGDTVEYAVQEQADGTGGAVGSCLRLLNDDTDDALVIGADTALVQLDSVIALLETHNETGADMTVLAAPNDGASDLGRVVLSEEGKISRIVEASEAVGTGDARSSLLNAGVYCFNCSWLVRSIDKLQPRPSGELYLTDLAAVGSRARQAFLRRSLVKWRKSSGSTIGRNSLSPRR